MATIPKGIDSRLFPDTVPNDARGFIVDTLGDIADDIRKLKERLDLVIASNDRASQNAIAKPTMKTRREP